jgi:hypothetical protein
VLKTICLCFVVAAFELGNAMAQTPYPIPTSREEKIYVGDYNYLDLLGNVATIVYNIAFTIIEEGRGNGAVVTHFAVDYDVYNKTWDKQGTSDSFILLNIMDAAGTIIVPNAVKLAVDRYSCTYGGARHEHQEGVLGVPVFQNARAALIGKQGIVPRSERPC